MRIGLISDTHGLLRPEALQALDGCERILHAGDIGGPPILQALAAVAPVDAVRGNNDRGDWAAALPERLSLRLAGVDLLMLHDLHELPPWTPKAPPARVVVAGHSHRPSVVERDGVLLVNPGSAGPRRFSLPVSVAWLELDAGRVRAAIQTLDVPARAPARRR